MPYSQIPLIGDFVRIICVISNAFLLPRIKENNNDEIVSERLMTQPNQLFKKLVGPEN